MDTNPSDITPEQSARIDRFVLGLEGNIREITKAYMNIPYTQNFQPEVTELCLKYGNEFDKVGYIVEELREELRLHYDRLQPELQRRL
ncbi:MAG: hypothetical protein Q8Q01_00505 [archaeon]|nr:hypothetical protein [archaeon]